ncbi:MAG: carboxylating nicotinate-nucleotide diphosphorylase [Oscillospiraceae bacterium]|jgi:nicotinate-nucleotide pyrophosphorylase (carboxylating)|nr:carboxylating nicotinate-nucleotide diphosphorylase [Oscillospiraceae bacterium]
MINNALDQKILGWLAEDAPLGDITTESCIPEKTQAVARLIAKQNGVICGLGVFKRVFELLDPGIAFEVHVKDGSSVVTGFEIACLTGSARLILTGERVALNLLQHLSGVATKARELSALTAGTKARIVDTRKTTPGLRELEKYAVRTGGASNHRFSLSDGVLIKDNHIAAAGGIADAVNAARGNAPFTLKIEVECETLEQVQEALCAEADIIMLDNMPPEKMAEAVKLIAGRAITEASGNMGERDIREVAAAGVDVISVGALTHSIAALDISLKFEL